MLHFRSERTGRSGFTIIELLVVVGVIGLLMALLLPAMSSFKRSSRAVVSQSNLRQWGVGTSNFCAISKDLLPWEGYKGAPEMHLNFAEPTWWANAVPPFVGQLSYRKLSEEATANNTLVPLPGDSGSIFIDPAAQLAETVPHYGGLANAPKQFFFCYVPNLQLNNKLEEESAGITSFPRMKLSSIPNPAATILMLEMRTIKTELTPTDPYYGFTLVRARSDWKRLAARHNRGGHVLLADGHVKHVDFERTTTNHLGTRDPNEAGGDWNKPNLIWNPRGPAVEGPGN